MFQALAAELSARLTMEMMASSLCKTNGFFGGRMRAGGKMALEGFNKGVEGRLFLDLRPPNMRVKRKREVSAFAFSR